MIAKQFRYIFSQNIVVLTIEWLPDKPVGDRFACC